MTEIWTMQEATRQAAIDGSSPATHYGSEFDGDHIVDVYMAMLTHVGQRQAAKFTQQVWENRAAAYDGSI